MDETETWPRKGLSDVQRTRRKETTGFAQHFHNAASEGRTGQGRRARSGSFDANIKKRETARQGRPGTRREKTSRLIVVYRRAGRHCPLGLARGGAGAREGCHAESGLQRTSNPGPRGALGVASICAYRMQAPRLQGCHHTCGERSNPCTRTRPSVPRLWHRSFRRAGSSGAGACRLAARDRPHFMVCTSYWTYAGEGVLSGLISPLARASLQPFHYRE